MNFTVLNAIFKRDFVNYFSNATGYVFICVFVVLSSLAAFWPPEFFSNNLANLDQLSSWMPLILLVFIPAITMSIWAEERRRGTDELLLTLPATDFDVVIGKYLAGVAIFTVSLLFSMASIRLIFGYGLGAPDPYLFTCTFLGYWFVGLAMLATGMVASFLTSNLTVGFILGMLFNAPQALASFVDGALGYLDSIPLLGGLTGSDAFRDFARGVVSSFSAFEGFSDFSRGVVSLSGALHFLCIVGLMLYICMVLIGRRHWAGGEDGQSLGWHYLVRCLALLLVVGGANTVLRNYDSIRFDMTKAQINSLSDKTVELVRELGEEEGIPPIKIDAYVSPQVPSEYAGQKRELLTALDELRSMSGGKVAVVKHEIENFSEEATRAERTFGIEPRTVSTRVRGALEEAEIFLGAAISCGLDKVVIPFLDKGIPVEYELVRSITTVADQKRKRVGVVKTDAELFGGFSMQGQTQESQLVAELKKQYDVVEVDPTSPITDTYDVLLAVQPSSLNPESFDNFVAAVKSGQPTAVFEDPLPVMPQWRGVVGTDEPKQRGGGPMAMFGGGGPPEPKGDMQQLWQVLGASMDGSQLIWQVYKPYADMVQATPDWVFVDRDSGATAAFPNESDISSGLKQTLHLFAGAANNTSGSKTKFQPLAVTNELSGTLPVSTAQAYLRGMLPRSQVDRGRVQTNRSYVLAAHITGEFEEQQEIKLDDSINDEALRAEAEALEEDAGDQVGDQEEEEAAPINVVLVCDIDCLSNDFFAIRAMGDDAEMPVDFYFQNVTFVLNVLDELAGDDRFIDVRKRSREYRTLTEINQATEDFRENQQDKLDELRKNLEEEIEAAREASRKTIAEIENDESLNPATRSQILERKRIEANRKANVQIAALEREANREIRQLQRDLAAKERAVQDRYKFFALVVPPILPIMLALFVFFHRRSMEKEGVSQDRLRYAKNKPAPATEAA